MKKITKYRFEIRKTPQYMKDALGYLYNYEIEAYRNGKLDFRDKMDTKEEVRKKIKLMKNSCKEQNIECSFSGINKI